MQALTRSFLSTSPSKPDSVSRGKSVLLKNYIGAGGPWRGAMFSEEKTEAAGRSRTGKSTNGWAGAIQGLR